MWQDRHVPFLKEVLFIQPPSCVSRYVRIPSAQCRIHAPIRGRSTIRGFAYEMQT